MSGGADRPPEGYLGADARIRKGPAPAMVEAGYRLEMADAAPLHRGSTLADLAHVIALSELGVIPRTSRRQAHAWVNRSPGGAGGVAGSQFPLDRERVAARAREGFA